MRFKIILSYFLAHFIFFGAGFVNQERDFVPNKETAIKIAEAVWLPIYGKSIYHNLPFNAKLLDTVWHVYGTLPGSRANIDENGDTTSITIVHGGVPSILINKSDARILRVSHGK